MPYLIRIVEWLEYDSRSHQPNRNHSGVSHLYKYAQADLQFCSPTLNKVTRGTEKVSWKQNGLSLQHLVSQALRLLYYCTKYKHVRRTQKTLGTLRNTRDSWLTARNSKLLYSRYKVAFVTTIHSVLLLVG
jgi:hypothetical protein